MKYWGSYFKNWNKGLKMHLFGLLIHKFSPGKNESQEWGLIEMYNIYP